MLYIFFRTSQAVSKVLYFWLPNSNYCHRHAVVIRKQLTYEFYEKLSEFVIMVFTLYNRLL